MGATSVSRENLDRYINFVNNFHPSFQYTFTVHLTTVNSSSFWYLLFKALTVVELSAPTRSNLNDDVSSSSLRFDLVGAESSTTAMSFLHLSIASNCPSCGVKVELLFSSLVNSSFPENPVCNLSSIGWSKLLKKAWSLIFLLNLERS